MCLILVPQLIAVQLILVAHRRAAQDPRRLERQQVWPPARPVAVLQAAMAQPSQTAHQVPHCLQDRPVRRVLRKL